MCEVTLPNITPESVEVQVYYGKILDNGVIENINILPMQLVNMNEEEQKYTYEADIELTTGGNYGYTFRVMPKHKMILNSENLNLIKWLTK